MAATESRFRSSSTLSYTLSGYIDSMIPRAGIIVKRPGQTAGPPELGSTISAGKAAMECGGSRKKELGMTTIHVTVPDISCGNCVAHIEKDIGALSGVASVNADETTKNVTIEFDESRVSLAQIAVAMDEAGYPIGE